MRWRILAIAAISVAALGAPAAHASVIQTPPNNIGLVGYWSFNEGTSTIAHDFSGHGNNGILSGSTLPTWVAGKLGKGLSFDGSTSYVNLGTTLNASLVQSKSYSYSLWFKTSVGGELITNTKITPDYLGTEFQITSGKIRFEITNSWLPGNLIRVETSNTYNNGAWHHVVMTYSGNGHASGITIYVDGKSASLTTLFDQAVVDEPSVANLEIGARDGANVVFNGSIDEVRIYNRALSAAEVAALYKTGAAKINSSQSSGTLSNGLVGWWTMDGADTVWSSATAGVEYDKSGNGNTGTLTSMNRNTAPVLGKIGQALKFDGATQLVSVPNISNVFVGLTSMTISGWVKPLNNPSNYQGYFGIRNLSTADFYVLQLINTNTLECGLRGSDGVWHGITTAAPIVTPNVWQLVTLVYDGSSVKCYVNTTAQSGSASGSISTTGVPLEISANYGASNFFGGTIDDVRIYNRALSAAEVQQLYNLGAGTHANTSSANLQNGSTLNTGLVGYWTFDGSTVTDKIYDLSGQGNNGYVGGGVATSSMKTIGKLGQALSFNGANTVRTSFNVNFSTMSVAFWFNAADVTTVNRIIEHNWNTGVFTTHLSAGTLNTIFNSTVGSMGTLSTAVSANTWYHVVMTYDGTTSRLYLNGVFKSSSVDNKTLFNANTTLDIGDGLNYNFAGKIDDVRIYNRALSAAEVQQLYLMGK